MSSKKVIYVYFLISIILQVSCNGNGRYSNISNDCLNAQIKLFEGNQKEGLSLLLDTFEKLEKSEIREENYFFQAIVAYELFALEKEIVRTTWFDYNKNDTTKKLTNFEHPYESLIKYATDYFVKFSVHYKAPSLKLIEKYLPIRWLICSDAVAKNFDTNSFKNKLNLDDTLAPFFERVFDFTKLRLQAIYLFISVNEYMNLFKKEESKDRQDLFLSRINNIVARIKQILVELEKVNSSVPEGKSKHLLHIFRKKTQTLSSGFEFLEKMEFLKDGVTPPDLSLENLNEYTIINSEKNFELAKSFISLSIESARSGNEFENISNLIKALEKFIFLESVNL